MEDDYATAAPFVFLSPNADNVVNIECDKLVKEYGHSDPLEIHWKPSKEKKKTHLPISF